MRRDLNIPDRLKKLRNAIRRLRYKKAEKEKIRRWRYKKAEKEKIRKDIIALLVLKLISDPTKGRNKRS